MTTALTAVGATSDAHHAAAVKIVRRYVLMSSVCGLITVPVVDVTVLAGVHLALIKAITEHYGHQFSEHAARNIVFALGASLLPGAVGSAVGRRTLRALPFVTPILGLATMSAFSAFVSYGLGTIFIKHYEAGGTLETFDVEHLHQLFNKRS
jgi:uncharacterized protein (DUF697 family)